MEGLSKKYKLKDDYKIDNIDEKNTAIIRKIKKKATLEEIIHMVEKNPNLLHKLDIPKLEIIDKYYKEKIAKIRKKLN